MVERRLVGDRVSEVKDRVGGRGTVVDDSHFLALGLFSQVTVEQQEKVFHLGPKDPLGLGVLNVAGHPVELVTHSFGSDTGDGRMRVADEGRGGKDGEGGR